MCEGDNCVRTDAGADRTVARLCYNINICWYIKLYTTWIGSRVAKFQTFPHVFASLLSVQSLHPSIHPSILKLHEHLNAEFNQFHASAFMDLIVAVYGSSYYIIAERTEWIEVASSSVCGAGNRMVRIMHASISK
jgi:hypothetical protein